MKIKVKLLLGLGVLFLMVLLLVILSAYFTNKMGNDTKSILVANYNSLDYCRKMQLAITDDISDTANLHSFETNLVKQQKNITENGEQELTAALVQHFAAMKNNVKDTAAVKLVQKDLSNIVLLNMQAIQRKSNVAEKTADQSLFWITLLGTICFVIALTVFYNLPENIANPIKQLSASIKQIAARNYSQRVYFKQQDEFGELAASFNTMAEKLEEYQASSLQRLITEKTRIETLINNMHDPVIGLDEKDQVLFMNDEALKLASVKKELVVGKKVSEIVQQNDLLRSLLAEIKDEPIAAKKDPVKIYADNKESYFEKEIIPIRVVPTGEKEAKMMGHVILLQNITPYKELDFAKTNFIATVSHELKTPISSIKMSLQLLENKQVGVLNADQQQLVESIKEDAARLLKITGELLNMTQVEAGSIQLSVMAASPAEIVNYAVNANKNTADNKQIRIQVQLPETISPVLADTDKTSWVLTNLISNAVRYSYENAAVEITVKELNDSVEFAVTDNGQGIEPKYVSKIFDRYFRIPGSKKEGTGLGLSISKEFIEAQGGTIEVRSELGRGSVFSFTLKKAL